MSNFKFSDDFTTLQHWSGAGYLDPDHAYTPPTSVRAILLESKYAFFDANKISIRLYDTVDDFTLSLFLQTTETFNISGNSSYYTITENDRTTTTTINRTNSWHLFEIFIEDKYTVKIDGTTVFTSTNLSRHGVKVQLVGGIWDDFNVYKPYEDIYQGGTGTEDDIKITTAEISQSGTLNYTIEPGYFYVDNIEHYQFGTMGMYTFTADPSGVVIAPSGLPYDPGHPYFVLSSADIDDEFDIVKTPVNKEYMVEWIPQSGVVESWRPKIINAYDGVLVYEAEPTRTIELKTPLRSTKLVLTDEGGTPSDVKVYSAYLDYSKIGDTYQSYAEVQDQYGSGILGITVTWYKISSDNTITAVGSATTNNNGIATISIPITEEGPLHIYATATVSSLAKWVQIPQTISSVTGSIFQLDTSGIMFDSAEARCAMSHNLWGQVWNTDTGTPTGLSYSNPTTRLQWEAQNPELERPPCNSNNAVNEPNGYYSAQDFYSDYPSIVGDDLETFMDTMYVAQNGYWGQVLLSGAQIRAESSITQAQVVNNSTTYEIDRDYGVTTGDYDIILNATGKYDSVYYVFYQLGSDYSGSSVNMAGNFYFRGVTIYDENLDQSNSQIQNLLSDAVLT